MSAMLSRLSACVIASGGIITMLEGWRIASAHRGASDLGIVGPDRYLVALGAVILIVALGSQLVSSAAPAHDATVARADVPFKPFLLLGCTVVYAILLYLVGFVISTLVFFLVAFRVCGVQFARAMVASAVAAVGFYALFVRVGGVSFPNGVLLASMF